MRNPFEITPSTGRFWIAHYVRGLATEIRVEMNYRLARGLAGLSKVCKTFREGFDSLPRLHVRLDRRFRADDIDIVFGSRERADTYRRIIEGAAFNRLYRAPTGLAFLTRDVIAYERRRADDAEKKMIEARKELSAVRRAKERIE